MRGQRSNLNSSLYLSFIAVPVGCVEGECNVSLLKFSQDYFSTRCLLFFLEKFQNTCTRIQINKKIGHDKVQKLPFLLSKPDDGLIEDPRAESKESYIQSYPESRARLTSFKIQVLEKGRNSRNNRV